MVLISLGLMIAMAGWGMNLGPICGEGLEPFATPFVDGLAVGAVVVVVVVEAVGFRRLSQDAFVIS